MERISFFKPIQDQEEKFNTLVENIKGVIYRVNNQGKILFISPTIKQLTGIDAREILGKHVSTFVYPDDLPDVVTALKRSFKGTTSTVDFRVVHKDGRIRHARATSLIDIKSKRSKVTGIISDVTELKKNREDLLLTRKALDSTSNPALLTDLKGRYALYQNEAFLNLTGYTLSEINLAGGAPVIYDSPYTAKKVYRTIIKGKPWKGEFELRAKDGRMIPVSLHTNLITSDKRAIGCFGVFTDMTEYRKLEADRQAAYQRLNSIIEFLPDPTFVINKDNRVIEWNRALEEMTGVTREEMLGRDDYSLVFYGESRPTMIDLVFNPDLIYDDCYDTVSRKDKSVIAEGYVFKHKDKGLYIRGTASAIYDSSGEVIGAIESIQDISERKRITEQLRLYALYDSLTGLYNRHYFEEEAIKLGGYKTAGIIVCDVDGLKLVNDTLGHNTGDAMIVATANVIKGCFDDKGIIARMGGDEFALLFTDVTEKDLEEKSERIREAVRAYNTKNGKVPLSISIGYAVTEDAIDVQTLFMEADNNMYREKLHSRHSARSAVVQTLMKTLKARDMDTREHADRLEEMVVALARAISVPENRIPDLRLFARFHDIGKVGIPDNILNKPGSLTKKEYDDMKRHSEIGYHIAMASPDLAPIADWILKHHEWWDGSGYPLGLKQEEIPMECRILTICDAYDAMTSDRPYRKAMTHEDAITELKASAGTQFVPELVQRFIEAVKK
ncbi:PAS domain S-box protein [Pelotomaculum propionicicum]|uniref:PAS domain S-box protein n=1 Tax=Pelotomaculum propionicicum TaxID=258475 RepID=UPI003B7BD193